MESIVDISEFFGKFKFICHWTNPFKDFEWSNVPRVQLSLFFESNDTFTSLQALSNLQYLFSSFMNYLCSWMKCADLESSVVPATNRVSLNPNTLSHPTKAKITRYHFIKENVEKGIVELFFVGTEYQLDDLFTKSLPVERFKYLVRRFGLRFLTPEELEALANESA
nr:ribonuclease H [Tanacetum cinerariifolium]